MMMMGMMMMLKMKLIGNVVISFHIYFLLLQTYFYDIKITLLISTHNFKIVSDYNIVKYFLSIGLISLKSMMMGGMSLMISMMMLMSKFGKGGGGGGPWKGGGGGGGGGKIAVFMFCVLILVSIC